MGIRPHPGREGANAGAAMATRRFRAKLWVALLAVCVLATGGSVIAADHEAEGVLVLGRVSDDPKRHYDALKALLDYVVPRMREVGIREGRVLMARDFQQMASYLRRGRVDWLTETAGIAIVYGERVGTRPLVATVRNGVARYHSVIFVRRDSGIKALADLRGRSVAFQNLTSTSAYFAPAASLLDSGLRLEILLSPMDRPATDSVGYLFARSESNIATWVHKRLVDAGAFSNVDWDELVSYPQSFANDLEIIHRTQEFPRALEIVRPGLEPAVEERLRQILLAANNDPEGQEALRRFFDTSRFEPVTEALRDDLVRLAPGVRRIRAELE